MFSTKHGSEKTIKMMGQSYLAPFILVVITSLSSRALFIGPRYNFVVARNQFIKVTLGEKLVRKKVLTM